MKLNPKGIAIMVIALALFGAGLVIAEVRAITWVLDFIMLAVASKEE